MGGRCPDGWHSATSILHERCPTCEETWKHGDGGGLPAFIAEHEGLLESDDDDDDDD
jgi:hypothetical protein